ncbi:MAG: hypothetical protein N2689_17250 [Verrucomicrobiae bacterium]|nr:hypothetical protein [Verrucomicrobiae bacterium]
MTTQIIASFQKTRPWVLFLSILGFISAGIMLLAGLAAPVTLVSTGKPESIAGGVALFVFYSVAAVLFYLIPSVLLSRYAARIGDLLAAPNDVASLEAAIAAQKSFWRYVGIFALIGLCIGVLCLVVALVAVGFAVVR